MPHALRLKDGKLITPFDLEDVLEIVEGYAGDEVRQYLAENLSDTDALEKELDRLYREHEEDLERLGDHPAGGLKRGQRRSRVPWQSFGRAEAGPKKIEKGNR